MEIVVTSIFPPSEGARKLAEGLERRGAGRLWVIGWHWALPASEIPAGLVPDFRFIAVPSEWLSGNWAPTPLSDQWPLAAICFTMLTGEPPPSVQIPPLQLLRPDATLSVRTVLDRALNPDPSRRYPSIAAMLRAVDRVVGSRTMVLLSGGEPNTSLSSAVPAAAQSSSLRCSV